MKLKPNMYVRTKKGIAKIVEIFDKENEPYYGVKYRTDTFLEIYYDSEYIGDEDILKASHNIIDLIEVGDFVNGEIVIGFGTFYYDDGTIERTSLTLDRTVTCLNSEIKSIVTKEQMEQMAYKIGK